MKVLFVGLGGVGQRHMRNLLRLMPDATIGAVRHRNRTFEVGDDLQPDFSVDIVQKYKITCFSNLDQGIAWEPNCAVVANPSSMHAETAQALVRAGVPVLLEKPIACDWEGARILAETSVATKVPVLVGYMQRFHPVTQRMLQWVHGGRLGRLLSAQSICHNYLVTNHSYEPIEQFYLGSRELGGGIILSEIHNTDLVHTLFGMPRRLWCVGGKRLDGPHDVEDTVTSLLDYQMDGQPFPVSMHISMVERPVARRIVVNGEHGRLTWDLLAQRVMLEDTTANQTECFETPDFQRNAMFLALMRTFLDTVTGTQDGEPNLRTVLSGHRIAMAMIESLTLGAPVDITEEGNASWR